MDPREQAYVRATAEPLEMVAALTRDADLFLVFLHLGFERGPEEVVAAAAQVLHPLGNLVLVGAFSRLCRYTRLLHSRGYAFYDLTLPLRPAPSALFGAKVLPDHALALVAFRDPGHVENPPALEGRKLLRTTVSEAPELPPEAREIPTLLVDAGLPCHLELQSGTIAALIERYSEPGGLVVTAGLEAARAGLVALLMGRRALVVLDRPEEVTAYHTIIRVVQDLAPPPPAPEREQKEGRQEGGRRAARTRSR